MFTGLVQEVGEIRGLEPRNGAGGADARLVVGFRAIERVRLELGASICVDGVCLTVARLDADSFAADVSGETLRVTTLGDKRAGSLVNLEPALRAGDSLGGHWVSGHVDGVAAVIATERDAGSLRVSIEAPQPLARYIARKGSVTLDGVSLTVNDVMDARFSINLIPHTLEVTTLGALAKGSRLNLEIDLLARYVERLNGKPLESVMRKLLSGLIVFCAFATGVAHAQLSNAGNGLINHPAANMTWEADGALFRTMAAANPNLVNEIVTAWGDLPLPFGHVLRAEPLNSMPQDFYPVEGVMTYWGAIAWIHYLNVTHHKGYSDWRMPDIGPSRPPGSCGGACYPGDINSSEWWRLFSQELGGVFRTSISVTHMPAMTCSPRSAMDGRKTSAVTS